MPVDLRIASAVVKIGYAAQNWRYVFQSQGCRLFVKFHRPKSRGLRMHYPDFNLSIPLRHLVFKGCVDLTVSKSALSYPTRDALRSKFMRCSPASQRALAKRVGTNSRVLDQKYYYMFDQVQVWNLTKPIYLEPHGIAGSISSYWRGRVTFPSV